MTFMGTLENTNPPAKNEKQEVALGWHKVIDTRSDLQEVCFGQFRVILAATP